MKTILETSNLSKTYDGSKVLDVDEFSVEEGETLVFLGPSGAGKSVLLRILNLLEPPSSGNVRLGGEEILGLQGREKVKLARRMAMLFQEPLLFTGSVSRNVAYGLKVRGFPPSEIEKRVADALRAVRLVGFGERHVSTLSGGEAQRVALARAMVVEPEVMFLDEPFANLDRLNRDALQVEVGEILKRKGMTAVFVTHDQQEAARLGDRILVLDEGRIVQRGIPSEIFHEPATESVARFVGMDNIYGGVVTSAAGGLARVLIEGKEIEVVGERTEGETITIGLRPEDITLVPAAEAGSRVSSRNALVGNVSRIDAQGPTAYVTVDCPFPVRALITSRSLEELGINVGSEVGIRFKATAVHVI